MKVYIIFQTEYYADQDYEAISNIFLDHEKALNKLASLQKRYKTIDFRIEDFEVDE